MSIIKKLSKAGKLDCNLDFITECSYEAMCGSFSYGVSSDTSDIDVVAVCVPPPEYVFPHLTGYVNGFGPAAPKFDNYSKHHIEMPDERKEYDISINGIVKFFALCADNNPNMLDALFVPARCVVQCDDIGDIMRDNRRVFLHKGAYHRFKGYAYSQMKKIRDKNPVGKRVELVEEHGYDVKFAYHVVRLALQAEQILVERDLDLERNREVLKSIRRGEWTIERLEGWFADRERLLDDLYVSSTIPHSPDWARLNTLLKMCLESKYGSMSAMMAEGKEGAASRKLEEIRKLLND